MPVTEFACMTIKPDLDVMNEDTPEGKILAKAWKSVAEQPTGPYRDYFGIEVENPSKLWAFFDFASVEDHEKFAKSFGREAVKDLGQILADSEFGPKHIDVKPFPPSALLAPVTEVMLAYFPADMSPAQKDAAASRLQDFAEKGLKQCADVKAVNFGWAVENDCPVRGDQEGRKGNLLTAFIGWPSIDAHMKFRDTEAFKETVGLLRGMEGMVKLTMFHVKCRSYENTTRKD